MFSYGSYQFAAVVCSLVQLTAQHLLPHVDNFIRLKSHLTTTPAHLYSLRLHDARTLGPGNSASVAAHTAVAVKHPVSIQRTQPIKHGMERVWHGQPEFY